MTLSPGSAITLACLDQDGFLKPRLFWFELVATAALLCDVWRCFGSPGTRCIKAIHARRLRQSAFIPTKEVSMQGSCSFQGLLIAENAG